MLQDGALQGGTSPRRLPHGLEHLRGLARRLVAHSTVPDEHLRVWVTTPTSALAAGAAVLGALDAAVTCDGCSHADVHEGDRVAVYAKRKFLDTILVGVTADRYTYEGSSILRSTATVYRLPAAFPDNRRATELSDQTRADLAGAYRCTQDLAGHRHMRASAHPVVVIGGPESAQMDITAWGTLTGDRTVTGRARCGDVDDWYRNPVLTAGSMPTRGHNPWLAEVRPRLVITTTTTAALAPTPWPDVPVLALLSRRSPSAVGAADLAHQVHSEPAVMDGRLGLALLPGHGLEIVAARIPADVTGSLDDSDTEEQW